MNRTRKSIKNIIFGFGAQLVTTLITFISRTVMLEYLGIEVVSVNSLFHEIISALSLAELGIGSAIVYNLYKPLAEKDENKVCQLMTFFKKAYRVIAGVIMLVGIIVCIFIPILIKDIDMTDTYLRFVFILFVVNISCSYLFSYKISLLNADQNNYLYSLYSTVFSVICAVINISVMLLTKNFVIHLYVSIALTLGRNIYLSRKIDRIYTYLHNEQLPKKDKKTIFDNVKNIFVKEISGKITSSTDNILISTIISTIVVGKYSFYSTILAVLKQFTERIDVNIRPSMGNLFASAGNEDCIRVLNRLTWGYCSLSVIFCSCFFSSCQSFISFWVGEEYHLDMITIYILTINLFCYISAKPIYSAMHVSGIFVEGRNISIIGSVVNLALSIILAQFIGLSGIFIGTFATYFIQIILKIYYVYKLRFQCSSRKYSWLMIKFSLLLVILTLGCNYICSYINTGVNVVNFVLQGFTAALISIIVLVLFLHRNEEFHYYKSMALAVLKKRKTKNS